MTFQKRNLPSAIEVEGRLYRIKTDFQYLIIFSNLIKKSDIKSDDFNFMFEDKIPLNKQKALEELIKWAYPRRELPRSMDEENEEILLDYEKDAELIYSAFFERYKIDLFDEKLHLHWYKFQALLFGLQGSRLNEVMKIRGYKPTSKESAEYKNQMQKLKRMWEIEKEFTEEEKQVIVAFERKLK